MSGDKIKAATVATAEFLDRLAPEDEVAVLTYSDGVVTPSEPDSVGNGVEGLAQKIRALTAGGGTSLHSAACSAAELAGHLQAADLGRGDSRLYGITLLSDWENTKSKPTEGEMFARCLLTNAEADGFKIFPIAFGESANESLLSRLALATGGRMFTADPDSISNVYFSISDEQ